MTAEGIGPPPVEPAPPDGDDGLLAIPLSGDGPTATAPEGPVGPGHTRLSASWTAVVAAAIVLVALIVFIGQNTQQSTVNFVGVHGKAPTAVVLLVAALAGAVIVIAVGTARILQLRKTTKQAARREARA